MNQYQEETPVVIIGMHRSGTTMLTKLLLSSGVDLGNDLEGNSEPKAILSINDKLLSFYGASWDYPWPFVNAVWGNEEEIKNLSDYVMKSGVIKKALNMKVMTWGWKEPRTTITFPVWKRIFPKIRIIHVFRHPIDVYLSLYNRELKAINKRKYIFLSRSKHSSFRVVNPYYSLRLWEEYTGLSQSITLDFNGLDICYERLLSNTDENIAKLSDFLSINIIKDFNYQKSRVLAFRNDPYGLFLEPSYRNNRLAVDLGYYDKTN